MSSDLYKSVTRRYWRLNFKWYDMWVGAFWDSNQHILYICPLPCVLITTWRQREL
jgi:hypothetical protein